MGSRVCTRCNNPPQYCRCEISYYLILLAVSLGFPIVELIIGKMLARSSLVLLDGLHALAHGAFFYFAFRVSREVHEESLSIFEEERRRKFYAAVQSAFLIGGMVLFLFLHVFGKISEPEEQNVFFTIWERGSVFLAPCFPCSSCGNLGERTRETSPLLLWKPTFTRTSGLRSCRSRLRPSYGPETIFQFHGLSTLIRFSQQRSQSGLL